MAHINRRYIDKHWLVYIFRGGLATIFGCFMLFCETDALESLIALLSIFLLFMGIVDAVGAIYSSSKKHGWINSVLDALIDVVAALLLLFVAKNDLVISLIILSVYTIISGIVDIFHGFLSTVDPTDRFIRILTGACGCVIGIVILNAGDFDIMTFIRFFGTYMLIVGISSLIYGVHNRAQNLEDKAARKEAIKSSKKSSKRKK